MCSKYDDERLSEALIEYFNAGNTPSQIVPVAREAWQVSEYERRQRGERELSALGRMT